MDSRNTTDHLKNFEPQYNINTVQSPQSGHTVERTPPSDGEYDEERIAFPCGQTILEKISVKRTAL